MFSNDSDISSAPSYPIASFAIYPRSDKNSITIIRSGNRI